MRSFLYSFADPTKRILQFIVDNIINGIRRNTVTVKPPNTFYSK